MKQIIIVSTLLILPVFLSAQYSSERRFKTDSCNFYLSIKPNGKFSYIYHEVQTVDMIDAIVGAEGKWSITNDTIILNDTTWPEENVNKKIYQVKIVDEFTLINLNFEKCNIGDTLHTVMMLDSLNRWRLSGKIINGKLMEGIKFDWEENLILRYKDGVAIDTVNREE